ncbi:MAG: helix-turn-helix transcriptional regulator [Proteobacteria bacterium]|nr:helix-turn-helix transcriptional regulator [Pseudomonadota bacterium]
MARREQNAEGIVEPRHGYERYVYSGFEAVQVFDVVYGGHFEHRLLSAKKRSSMEHQRLILGDMHIDSGRYDFPVVAQGAMPRDLICIGMVVDGLECARYNTRDIEEDDVQLYPRGVELLYHAQSKSRWITLTLPQATFQQMAVERAGRPLTIPRGGPSTFRMQRGQCARLRQMVDDALALARTLAPAGASPQLGAAMGQAILRAYVDALCAAQVARGGATAAAARRHHRLILDCERLVLDEPVIDVDLVELARRSGYSLRSLELVFRRAVGMTPSRWFANIRLNGVLRDLIAPAKDCRIGEVATRWGFQHLPRFAQQYRQAFGELPSATLGRARAHGLGA